MKSRKLFGLVAATLVYSIAGNAAADERAGDLSAHMHEHWQQITQIQAALIRGDLAAVREPAEYLATHPTPAALPGQWEEYVNEMRAAARAAADAQDFAAAATATSLMGNACGSCHTDNGIEVRFEEARDAHNWENWRDRLRNGLSWLFPGPQWMVYE